MDEYIRDKDYIAHTRYLTKQCENHARGDSARNQRSKNWNQDKSRNWVKKVTKTNNSSYRTNIKHDPECVNSKNRKKLNDRIGGEARALQKKNGTLFHHTDQIIDNWEKNRLILYYGFFKQDFPEKIEKLELLDDYSHLNGIIDNIAWKEIKKIHAYTNIVLCELMNNIYLLIIK